jgi:hypothetical protein
MHIYEVWFMYYCGFYMTADALLDTNIVICKSIARQRPKHTVQHATIEQRGYATPF